MRISIVLVAVIVTAVAVFLAATRPVTVQIRGTLPRDFPESGFSHRTFEALLRRFVNASGEVDYDAWHASQGAMAALEDYLAAVAAFSPGSSPARFPSQNDALAYWMYAYNAYVLKSVLDNWPITSVTDIKAPIEAVKGLGFFYRCRYVFGGEALNLYTVENDYIRKRYGDPRIHFVLNCASASCPVLRPELPTGDALESLLATATEQFVSEPRNVSVDHESKVVRLSPIFKMYRKDFANHVRASGRPAGDGVLAYLRSVAPDALRAELEAATGYDVEFREFDWSVNAPGVPSRQET